MVLYKNNHQEIGTDEINAITETSWRVPRILVMMLQDVNPNLEEKALPANVNGEFWYWRLSYYGLDLMGGLVRASNIPFSYDASFMELEPRRLPQLVLLNQINHHINAEISHLHPEQTWETILNASQYLSDKRVSIDKTIFQREIERLIQKIEQGCYEASGDRRIRLPQWKEVR